MTIKATEGRVIVQRIAAESQFSNGLIIPDQLQSQADTATVVTIHEGSKSGIVAGDTVLLTSAYAGADFSIDGEDYTAVLEEEIVAVL